MKSKKNAEGERKCPNQKDKTHMTLHLVAFDIPYPANYGGVIVIYNQLRALKALGVDVILHCYQYKDRTEQPELAKLCKEVYYYERPRTLWYQLSIWPFIMTTRNSRKLYQRLKQDKHPIIFEGMHTALMVRRRRLRNRQKIVRMHNIEWQYYENLYMLENDPGKKLYYFIESIKLQRTEPYILLHTDAVITMSTLDQAYYREEKANTQYIPVFHSNDHVSSKLGRGEYVLYQGKLSVNDNERSVLWLIKEVFAHLDIPFVVAGLDPSDYLKNVIQRYPNIRLVENPDQEQMDALIREAHVNLLYSFQTAGSKLKLVNALFKGRFCVANDHMVAGTNLDSMVQVRNSSAAIRQTIEALFSRPFDQGQIDLRRATLEVEYSNIENTKKLLEMVRFEPEKA
jgi:Glycosyltransferase Family 4/Glycosyl transferases group 1